MAQALPPPFVICRTVCSQSAIRLAVTMTFAPSAPNRSAIALPMPLLLPVTIATFPFNRCMCSPFLYTSLQGSGPGCPLLRATFSPTQPRARRDALLSQASTVSPCAFCEQKGHLTASFPSFGGRRCASTEAHQPPSPPLLQTSTKREWSRLPSTARIERPQLYRGGSASKEGA